MPTEQSIEQSQKELQTRLQMHKLVSRINKGDTSAIIDELLALLEYFKNLPAKPRPGIDYEIPKDGVTPKKGEDYFTDSEIEEIINAVQQNIKVPKDGKDYVLTEKDKEVIASKIKVPVVEKVIEKVEVIKEQPIITQQIREIAFYEEPDKIADKLKNFKKAWIELSQIEGFEEYMRGFGESFLQQAKSFVPRSLDSLYDVAVRGKITDGQSLIWNAAQQKWIPGTGASSGSLDVETPVGTQNDSNVTFTVSNTPVFLTMNGQVLTGSGVDYTYADGTITLVLAPSSGDIFRSYHN